jgi:predicted nucleotidyltransferase
MEQSIELMVKRITDILKENEPSIVLFGSVVLDDFKLGWSDIDFICLTKKAINKEQANELVNMRQTLLAEYKGNQYFRLFEGIMMTLEAFINNADDTVVYWGTSGQRLENNGRLCRFGEIELLENGKLLFGNDFRHLISYPTRAEVLEAIKQTYVDIRTYCTEYPCMDWLLDIARCLYTLKTNKVIAKTKAGEWAIEENKCPDISIMKKILEVRKEPLKFRDIKEPGTWNKEIQEWQKTFVPYIQRFADVLEAELRTGCDFYLL